MSDTAAMSDWEGYASELGLRLQKARQGSGLSQEKVSHAAGISTFTYRKLEHGLSNPDTPANPRLKTLVALAEVLQVPLAELIPDNPPSIAEGRTWA